MFDFLIIFRFKSVNFAETNKYLLLMMILYLFGIKVYFFLMQIVALFNSKAKLWLDGRKSLLNRLEKEINKQDKIAWFHCASLGEFEQGRPVIEEFKKRHNDYKILLTFFSPSGYEVRKNYEYADYIYYLPLDTPYNARRFVDIVKPSIVFFVKYEFWPFFINEIGKRKVPLYLISGIFRKEQRFFKWYGYNSRKMLKNFDHFFIQNHESKKLLQSIGFNNNTISGDTRFDRVNTIANQAKQLELIESFVENTLTLIAGSTWKPDEELIIRYFNEKANTLKLIIAPHEIHRENIERIAKSFDGSAGVLLYSNANQENIKSAKVLIIDSIGLLSSLYRYADIAYIGGGFGKGIHNTLEAATFGMPILFGPNYLKFQEAVDLVDQQSAVSINSYKELEENINSLVNNEVILKSKGELSASYVKQKCGATKTILESLNIDIS